jgi:hypothetical protein
MTENAPENIEVLKKLAADKASYKNRLEAVGELGKTKCRQAIDILWRLMINDKVHAVQNAAFLKLQAFGEDVKLPRKAKGKPFKDIEKKLVKVLAACSGVYSEAEFNRKFSEMYPEEFDVYSFEKRNNFSSWVENVLSCLPTPKA